MTRQGFEHIFIRLQQGQATQDEMEQFLEALQKQAELKPYFQKLLQAYFENPLSPDLSLSGEAAAISETHSLEHILAEGWQKIEAQTALPERPAAGKSPSEVPAATGALPERGKRRPLRWAAAACALFLLALGAGYWLTPATNNRPAASRTATVTSFADQPIVPGKSAAILTLANGSQVPLDSNADQRIQSGTQLIAYNKAGTVHYQANGAGSPVIQYNTLTTRKGNRYQLVLPDGSQVWLNAESSIRFPDKFPKDQRTVYVTGEVYFEVKHDPDRPFTVQVKGQSIRDIGTAFNVNAYENEASIKTTLVEGIIEINHTRLRPGWQASIQPDGRMTIDKNADLEEVTSWKNNIFLFHQTDMKSILRQVARWYDVEIIYQGTFDQTFTGGISRQTSLEEMLKILSFSHKIKFQIHDRNIIVQSN